MARLENTGGDGTERFALRLRLSPTTPNLGPSGARRRRSRITAFGFGHIGRATRPANLSATPSHFGHDTRNLRLGCLLDGDWLWRFRPIGHHLDRVVGKLVDIGFRLFTYSLRHTLSVARAAPPVNHVNFESSPLPRLEVFGW
jgi:hypothetical protein